MYNKSLLRKVANKLKKSNGIVYVVGNGGSSATASHMVGDLRKQLKKIAICPSDNVSSLTAYTNDNGWEKAYTWINNNLTNEDIMILVSVHGGSTWSSNLVNVGKKAHYKGAYVVGLSGHDGGKFNQFCDVNIIVNSKDTFEIEYTHSEICHEIIRLAKELK